MARALHGTIRGRAGKQHKKFKPPPGEVSFGSLRSLRPVSSNFGFERGTPVDRYYIEGFLEKNKADIRGHVLEAGFDAYTRRFGGNVLKSDVLDAKASPDATVVANLENAANVPSNSFDCIILTETLNYVYDAGAAAKTLHRILKPGGVLLATFPGIAQITRPNAAKWDDYWHFTSLSAQKLFAGAFGEKNVATETYGNVLSAIAFLHGLAAEELTKEELDYNDPDYELKIATRAVKARKG